MAANNVETVFRLPSGVNEEFIRNLLWQHQQQQHQQENNQQQQRNISSTYIKGTKTESDFYFFNHLCLNGITLENRLKKLLRF